MKIIERLQLHSGAQVHPLRCAIFHCQSVSKRKVLPTLGMRLPSDAVLDPFPGLSEMAGHRFTQALAVAFFQGGDHVFMIGDGAGP